MKPFVVLLGLFSLAGCGALLERPDPAPQTFEAYPQIVTPHEEWKDRMACFGNLVDAYLDKPVYFGIRTIRDNTLADSWLTSEGIPKVVTVSLLQSFNMISPRLKVINLGRYEGDQTIPNVISSVRVSDFLVGGGISSVDRVVIAKSTAGDLSLWLRSLLDDLRFKAAKTVSASRISIRLLAEEHIVQENEKNKPERQTWYEARYKANAGVDLLIWREGTDLEGSFGVYGVSAGVSVNLRKLPSMGAAVEQGLLFTSMVLIGKTLGIPYHRCLGGKVDPDVIDIVKHQFLARSHKDQLDEIARKLLYYGITVKLPEVPSNGIPEPLRHALATVRSQHREFTWSVKNPDLQAIYCALYFHIDPEKARARHQRKREQDRERLKVQVPQSKGNGS